MTERQDPILEIDNLTKHYESRGSFIANLLGRAEYVKALDGVTLDLFRGETLGVVGESGCGKTTLGRTLLRLVEPTAGAVTYRQRSDDGQIEEIELTGLSSRSLRDIRTDLQYIFQDPFSSLNPRMTVGDIIGEPLDVHKIASGQARRDRISELLETVGLNASHAQRYPHEFSGGQRQRIGIARALAVDPEVIVCDEPVSALDVSVQAQILNLLEELQEDFDLSYIFIAHDLSVVEHISDRVAVMYLGEVAEVAPTDELFASPRHPYAEALLSVIPEPDPAWGGEKILLSGEVPSATNPPDGCRFHTRCHRVIPPDGSEVSQSTWRSVLDLKLGAREADSIVGLVTRGESEARHTELTDPDQREIDHAIRHAFDLPSPIADGRVEEVIQSAIEAAHAEGPAAAAAAIEEALVSPCEHTPPGQYEVGTDHRVSCLLYDDPGRRDDLETPQIGARGPIPDE